MLGDLDGRFGLGRRCGVVVGVGDVDGAARGRDGAGGDLIGHDAAGAGADCGVPAFRVGQSPFTDSPRGTDGETGERDGLAVLQRKRSLTAIAKRHTGVVGV